MMRTPSALAAFIESLQPQHEGQVVELVIAGDFVDFLALTPYADFTPDPAEARAKLETVCGSRSPCAPVFDALARHVAGGRRLTVIVGNHDVELGLPAVQEALLRRLAASPHDVLFVDDGRAYRVGRALVEHGNAYDGANANDWDGLRHLRSAQSRGLPPERDLRVSPGSQIVYRVVNELKERYSFLPLLQPEGEILALLLFALEPSLAVDLPKLRQILRGRRLAGAPPRAGVRPMAAAAPTDEALDPELLAAFPGTYRSLAGPRDEAIGAFGAWLRTWASPRQDSLSELLRSGRPVPPERLKQLRVTIEKLLRTDRSTALDGPTEQYGDNAESMLSSGEIDAVVMGHTHLPRRKEYPGGTYVNAGTWIDRIVVPLSALQDGSGAAFDTFLRTLLTPGGVRPLPPTFADLALDEAGRVTRCELRTWDGAP